MPEFTLHVVCPNPALDRLQLVSTFLPFEVNRVSMVRSIAGGKGMIVCRAARRLGATVAAYGFVGGSVGDLIRAGCHDMGVTDRHVQIDGETRITPVVIEESTGRSTVLNERGPEVGDSAQEQLLDHLSAQIRPGDVVVTTGSLPPGCPSDLYARIARLVHRRGGVALIDAHGATLAAVIADLEREPAPMVLKPNIHELADVLDTAVDPTDTDAIDAEATRLASSTGATIVVTRGAHGSLWHSAGHRVVVDTPAVETVNPTGSGDAFLAGLAVSLGRGRGPEESMRLASAMGAANAASLLPDIDVDLVMSLVDTVTVESTHAAA